ncbi:MAG: cytochrome c oxidase accessory protein CcoG [Chitinophagales bacterium]|jgi:cytochrome c oxidase accessory protein FixG|nr:cytochrome c oxidase accessory protein CcoG [Chitinophagales bacterium]
MEPESFRDRISTVDKDDNRKWVYALKPSGYFYKLRSVVAYFLIAMIFLIPFIEIKGKPFFQVNVLDARIYLFGKVFWPQDFYILAFLFVSSIIGLVVFTVIYGRLFCGWVCPQTLFLEFIYRPIEWLIEGSPQKQKIQDKLPLSKTWTKKLAKHILYFLISLLIAHVFLSYILGVKQLMKLIKEPITEHKLLILGLLVFSFMFYIVFAYLRELVCTTFCPYGRLQSVMLDKDTMQVSYDHVRGEERQRFSKNHERTGGDCIDCHKCVEVCPIGIDIRHGAQLECTGCTACIDACDEIMVKVGFPTKLISYRSTNQIETRQGFSLNTRAKAYTMLLVVLITIFGILLATRKSIDPYLNKVRGQTYIKKNDKIIGNLYHLQIINKNTDTIPFKLHIDHGNIYEASAKPLILYPEKSNEFTIWLDMPENEVQHRITKLLVTLSPEGYDAQQIKVKFLGPF